MLQIRMRLLTCIFGVVVLLHCSYAPPVTHNETKTGHKGEEAADWVTITYIIYLDVITHYK